MESKSLKTAVTIAIVMGVFLPLAETVRRANQIFDFTKFFRWKSKRISEEKDLAVLFCRN
jgi:hypothetical protein